MKLATYQREGQDRLGVLLPDGSGLVDLSDAIEAMSGAQAEPWAGDMISFIEAGSSALDRARAACDWVLANPGRVAIMGLDDVRWRPPVPRPTKICCLALNNSANADRIVSGPSHPAIFIKGANALIGHGDAIIVKPGYGRVHPEPELAVVIGRRAKEIDASNAFDHVFGYTIHNDITSPSMRAEDTFNYRAIHPGKDGAGISYVDSHVSYSGRYKGSDTFSPMGPWIATRDEIGDPHTLNVSCSHKGELVTEDNTSNLFHKVPEVLAFVSGYMTLEPGDIVSMGTALKQAAVGGRAVQNVDLAKLGGPITVSIERIGTLSSNVTRI